MKKKRFAGLAMGLVLVGIGITGTAGATLISEDLSSSGDGQLTYDSTTRLAWLDLTNTNWVPTADVLSGFGGYTTTLGFRYATGSEVATLLDHAGITEGRSTTWDITNINNTRNLIYLLGVTHTDGHTFLANGYIADPSPGVRAGGMLAVNDIGEYDAFSNVLISSIPNYFETMGAGSFLVKDPAPIPVGTTIDGGTIAPGGTDPIGEVKIAGDLTLKNSAEYVVDLDLAGLKSDYLGVDGTLNLGTDSLLDLNLINDLLLGAGKEFQIVGYRGSDGNYFKGFADGYRFNRGQNRWEIDYRPGGIYLTSLGAAAVPEPSSLALLLLAGGLLGARRRRH